MPPASQRRIISRRLIRRRVRAVRARSSARPLARHTCASQVREYLAPPRRRLPWRRRPHGRYVVTMKGVAFEDQKLLALPSALSYDWLLPGVENGGPRCRLRRTPFRAPSVRRIRSRRTVSFLRVPSFPGGEEGVSRKKRERLKAASLSLARRVFNHRRTFPPRL